MRLSEKLSYPIRNTPFVSRPLCFLCAVFLCALICIQINSLLFFLFSAAVIAYALYLCISDKVMKPFTNPMPYLLLIMLILAVISVTATEISYYTFSSISGAKTLKVTVLDEYYAEQFGSLLKVKLTEINGVKASGNALLRFDHDPLLSLFDTVTVTANVAETATNMTFGELLTAKSGRICFTADVTEVIKVTDEGRNGLRYSLYELRQRLGSELTKHLLPKTGEYAKAILLGDDGNLSSTFRTDMSALGISHILAVSGMHTSIIATMVSFAADRFRSSRKLKSVTVCIISLIFMAIAGFSPSVIRAVIMLNISLLAVFFGGKSDSLTSLMLSGVIICLFEPANAISCSFLLSFCATLGIVLCALYAERSAGRRLYSSRVGDMKPVYKIVKGVLYSLLVTLCATLFTVPVMSVYFNETSFFSFFINPVAIPMAFVSMVLSVFVLIFGGVPIAGDALCRLFDLLYEVFEGFVHLTARSFPTSVSLLYPFFIPCLILVLTAFVFLWVRRIREPVSVIAVLLCGAIVFVSCVQIYGIVTRDRCEAVYMCDENSEGIVLNYGDETVYIDIGNGSRTVPENGMLTAKSKYYETVPDGYMLTHYHTDHIGTVKYLLTVSRIEKLYLPIPECEKDEEIYYALLRVADMTEAVTYKRGEEVTVGNATVTTLPYSLLERSEHPVIALKISKGAKSIAYLGASVSESGEHIFAEKLIDESSALIIGRHGPVTKENLEFLTCSAGKKVYLTPYEDGDEHILFPNGSYIYPENGDEEIFTAGFSLS